MRSLNTAAYLILVFVWLPFACKSTRTSQSKTTPAEEFIQVSDIVLSDKPLDTIKKYVTGQKWRLIYSIGGITGNDKNSFDSTYYTLTKAGKMITEKGGSREEVPYTWEEARDIFTGNNIYVISGVVHWKVEGINNDTLRLSDNYVDGYGYALIRAK